MEVSIIVPIYQVEKFLDETLHSAAIIKNLDFEVLMIDDGSTDGSARIAQGYASRYENFIYRKTENQGVSAARNFGMSLAKGDYIAFCDGDDILMKNGILNMHKAAVDEGADIVIGEIIEYNMTGFHRYAPARRLGLKKSIEKKDLDLLWTFMISGKLYRREFLLKHNLRFSPLRYAEDALFFVDCIYHAQKITGCPGGAYGYRKRLFTEELSATQTCSDLMWSDFITAQRGVEKLYERYLKQELTKEEQDEYLDELQLKIADNIINGFCRYHWSCEPRLREEIWDNYFKYADSLSNERAARLEAKNIQPVDLGDELKKPICNKWLAIVIEDGIFKKTITEAEKKTKLLAVFRSIYDQKWVSFKLVIETRLWRLISDIVKKPENIEIVDSVPQNEADYDTAFVLHFREPALIGTDALIHAFRHMKKHPECRMIYACQVSKKVMYGELTRRAGELSMLDGRIRSKLQEKLVSVFKRHSAVLLIRTAGGYKTEAAGAFRAVKL